jgi:diacylglycerol kinase
MPFVPPQRSWFRKFADALAGIGYGMRGQNSFVVHLTAAAIVVAAAALVRVTAVEWCLLAGAIALVLAAELFNSALEHLAKAITREENEHLRIGLDIAGGAVLIVSLGAAVVGALVFVPYILGWR